MRLVNDAIALDAPRPGRPRLGLEQTGTVALFAMGRPPFSSRSRPRKILLAIALICWITLLVVRPRAVRGGRAFFWPLVAYGAVTVGVGRACRRNPHASLMGCKQLVLILIVAARLSLHGPARAPPRC